MLETAIVLLASLKLPELIILTKRMHTSKKDEEWQKVTHVLHRLTSNRSASTERSHDKQHENKGRGSKKQTITVDGDRPLRENQALLHR